MTDDLTFTCGVCEKKMLATEVLAHSCMVGKGMVIPDSIGEVVGWRAWHVIGEGKKVRLGSVTHSEYTWQPGSFQIAQCPKHKTEEIPAEGHTCGFYAAKTREHLLSMTYHRYDNDQDVVIGEVAMSGKIIPGTQGWRAQRARIQKVYVPYERWRLVEAIKDVYGCEVELSNTLSITPKGKV